MKFFIDTANVEDIRKANDMGVICGVTTNPSLIAKEGRDFKEVIKEITTIVDGPISGEVKATTVDAEGMIKEGLIANEFDRPGLDYIATPAVLCKNHGPFTWGKDAHEAVHNAVVLEEVAKMAARCELINPKVQPAPQELQDKHYFRKHGANAYYGQPGK